MELLLGFLRNPKFKMRLVIKLIQEQILPLKQKIDWGPSIPYNLGGQMNLHPRDAMEFREGKDPDNYIAFYDQLMQDY
jgi:4-hydroxy 2-oxovalerate aldolase